MPQNKQFVNVVWKTKQTFLLSIKQLFKIARMFIWLNSSNQLQTSHFFNWGIIWNPRLRTIPARRKSQINYFNNVSVGGKLCQWQHCSTKASVAAVVLSGGSKGAREGEMPPSPPTPLAAWQYNAHQLNVSYELVNLSFIIAGHRKWPHLAITSILWKWPSNGEHHRKFFII